MLLKALRFYLLLIPIVGFCVPSGAVANNGIPTEVTIEAIAERYRNFLSDGEAIFHDLLQRVPSGDRADLIAAAFETAVRNFRPDRGTSFQIFMRVILRGRIIDHLRRKASRLAQMTRPISGVENLAYEIVDPGSLPIPDDVNGEFIRAVLEGRKGPEALRDALFLLKVYQMNAQSGREAAWGEAAARESGVKIGSLKSRMSRCLERLRQVAQNSGLHILR